jgi:hypothetical protein
MAKYKQRQALAVSARLSPQVIPGYSAGAIAGLEQEAARIVAAEAERRDAGSGCKASGHIVIDGGHLSGFVKDAHTTVRFAGGSVAVTTHD